MVPTTRVDVRTTPDTAAAAGRCASAADGLTVPALVHRNADAFGDLPALSCLGRDETLTWAELYQRVTVLARGFSALGVQPGDRLLLMMGNRPEHWLADLAAVHAGAVPCSVYPTSSPEQLGFVARHSRARALVVENAAMLDRWRNLLGELPELRLVVVVDAPPGDDGVVALEQVAAAGDRAHRADPGAFRRVWSAIRPADPVTLLYTSGATGDPKGVALSHHNVIYQAAVLEEAISVAAHPHTVAYLPLAHIAERMLGIYQPVYRGAHVTACPDPSQLTAALQAVRPVQFFGVPRVWEKIAAVVQAQLAAAEAPIRSAYETASAAARTAFEHRAAGRPVPPDLAAQLATFDAKVLRPIRAKLGLDRLEWASSGAAPIPVDILFTLAGLGIDVLEVWGMTETTATVTVNLPEAFCPGTVGRPNPGMDLRLAADGEILVRGPLVCLGYLGADGEVEPVTDADGWFATGDVGTLDDEGYLTITDRKKELIITSTGKNVPPTRVENLLRLHPLVGHAMAVGDRRSHITALVALDPESLAAWAVRHDADPSDVATLSKDERVLAEIAAAVAAANAKLARPEQVKAFRVLPSPWTPESGELTPTHKLRRRVIADRYDTEIAALYADSR
ncbi:AMP-dependent synthetase/ligase [Plantactinospora sp. ZYX-F-223]|uniref:AMP-dependent synthetase/ligase n=1 Tax=Plantactinospora sp. ZYX-F-223 TaxID=3144103 RepID=UPI0031FDF9BA